IVGLKHYPLGSAIEALLEKQRSTAHGNIFPFRSQPVSSLKGACSPNHSSNDRERAQTIHTERVQFAVLCIGERNGKLYHSNQSGILPGWRLPYSAVCVGAGKNSGYGSARCKSLDLVVMQRVRFVDSREKQCCMVAIGSDEIRIGISELRYGCAFAGPGTGRIHDVEGAPCLAIRRCGPHHGSAYVIPVIRRDAKQIEQGEILQSINSLLVALRSAANKVGIN